MAAGLVAHVVQSIWLTSRGAQWWAALAGSRTEHARFLLGGQVRPLVEAEPWRLFTSVWVHADLMHLLLNLTALAIVGRVLEPWVGLRRLWAWFALGAVAGSVLPHLVGVVRSDGASGGAFALLAAATVVAWRHRRGLPPEDFRALGPGLTAFLVGNLALSMVVPAIDAAAHVGGTLAGVVVALLPRPRPLAVLEWIFLAGFAVACVFGWL